MKQVLQNIATGETMVVDVPCPINEAGKVLISSRKTVVSTGTERMLVEFGKANYIEKARQQPDKVKDVVAKIKTDGLLQTLDAVRSKLDQPLSLGYCNAGVVIESGVDGFEPGDRVVSNGNHAEVVRVPKNLCVKIPDNVDDESAAFTVLGAIGLQGIRLLEPTLGECFVVTGLGLIGLLSVQMLVANGCRVLGIDFDSNKCDLARRFGAEVVDLSKGEDAISIAQMYSRGRGVDGVLITAASRSDEIMHEAAEMCRKRGRIVLVGVVGLNLRRDDFFKKEISFRVSASYGPGRYDTEYEEKGNDYPIGFVRWTEQRNFEAVLDMMASGTLDVEPLITHRFQIDEALKAYELLDDSSALGIVLDYPGEDQNDLRASAVTLTPEKSVFVQQSGGGRNPVVGFVGAGNYASRVLIPAFRDAGVVLDTLVTSGGVSGVHHGKKNGFKVASTRIEDLWASGDINTVVIATRHNLHADEVVGALRSGKHVFVEKPLALTLSEIKGVEEAYAEANAGERTLLMVGFNRRFAPHVIKMKSLLEAVKSPKTVIITVNAGAIPADHWVQDPAVGGGRIIGEGCHFVDLMRHLVGAPITGFDVVSVGDAPGIDVRNDKVSITLSFEDGSFGTIHYLANGAATFPKERVEVFCDNRVLQLDNYRVLRGFGWPGFKAMRALRQDKGQKRCVSEFVDSVRSGGGAPIAFDEIVESSRISVEIENALREKA